MKVLITTKEGITQPYYINPINFDPSKHKLEGGGVLGSHFFPSSEKFKVTNG